MRLLNAIGNRFTGRADFSDQYQRYRETLLWIVTELFRFDSKKTFLSILFNVTGGLFKAGALAMLLYYANLMERAMPISMLGFSWDSRSESVFFLAIFAALVLLVCGALAVYFGKNINYVLSIAFASHCSKVVLCATGGRPERNPCPTYENYHPGIKSGVTGIIGLVRGVKPVLQVSNPLSTLLYSLVVLFYLNSLVTLVVLVLALASLLFQYKVNFHAVQNEGALFESRKAGKEVLGSLFDDLVLTPKIYPSRAEWIDREYRHSAVNDFMQRYYQRVIAGPRSALVGDMLLAILLLLVVGYLGGQALAGKSSWAHFLAYLLFARVSLLAFRGLLVSITGFARHYPRVRRIAEFYKSLNTTACRDIGPLVVSVRGKDRIGDRKKVKLNPGDPFCILTKVPLTRFNLYAFVDAIAGRDVESSNRLCAGTACITRGVGAMPGGSIDELMAIPETASAEFRTDSYKLIGLKYEAGMTDMSALLSDAGWRELPDQTRACLLLEQAKEDTARLVLADAAVLAKCGDAYMGKWRAALGGKFTGIVSDDTRVLSEFDCKFAVLMASDRSVSVATAPWCLDNPALIDAWFDRCSVQVEADYDEEAFDDE